MSALELKSANLLCADQVLHKPLPPLFQARSELRMHTKVLWLAVLAMSCGVAAPELSSGSESLVIGPVARRFELRGLWGKCLDFGGGTPTIGGPVFMYSCNGTIAQQVEIQEIGDGQHTVQLKAGGLCIGAGGTSVNTFGLELQPCSTSFPWQLFQIDGDSLLTDGRRMAVRPKDWRGEDRTPLIIAPRQLDERERWTFRGLSGFPKPTFGFIQVPQQMSLLAALTVAHHGTVIELDPSFDFSSTTSLEIPAGVTLRGGRTATVPGARLRNPDRMSPNTLLVITGPDVRITGLRIEGPTDTTSSVVVQRVGGKFVYLQDTTVRGINAPDGFARTFIDNNELSKWRGSAVGVDGADSQTTQCPPVAERTSNVRVLRNHIHHNRRDDFGYGVTSSFGAFAHIEGNYFDDNRHAIATDGRPFSGYRAVRNLVSPNAPKQKHLWYTHDFDVHGRGEGGLSEHRGGVAGDFFDISWNTFMGTNRENFDLRGTPCQYVWYVGNMSRRTEDEAINSEADEGSIIGYANLWSQPDFTLNSATRDFDGDGVGDRLIATGAAWYVQLRGTGPWRYWNGQTQHISDLMFYDANSDGRVDVLSTIDGIVSVSWAGISPFEPLVPQPVPPPRAAPLPLAIR